MKTEKTEDDEIEEVEIKIQMPREALGWMEKFASFEDMGLEEYFTHDLLESLRARIESDELAEMSYSEVLGPEMLVVFARHNMLADLDPSLKRRIGEKVTISEGGVVG